MCLHLQVDFLPAKAMTPEELQAQQERVAALAKATKVVQFQLDGAPAQYELFFVHAYKTNGGMMYDVTITFEEQETRHRSVLAVLACCRIWLFGCASQHASPEIQSKTPALLLGLCSRAKKGGT